jgi:hypothetical protein
MTFRVIFLSLFLLLNGCLLSGNKAAERSLRDIYKSGKIRFSPLCKIDRDSFPDRVKTGMLTMIAAGDQGEIFISDIRAGNIKVVDSAGKFKNVFGQSGEGPGDLNFPYYLAFSQHKLIVWELVNRRFSLFKPDGRFIKFAKLSRRETVRNVKALADGRLVVEFERTGVDGKKFYQLCTLSLYSRDFKFIKDIYSKKVLRNKYIEKPFRSNIIQPFQPDVTWDILPGSRVAIGYSKQYEIEIHDLTNHKVRRFSHPHTPQRVTERDRENFFSGMYSGPRNGPLKKGADPITMKHTEFPEFKPAYKRIVSDYEGNILVFPHEPIEGEGCPYVDAFDPSGNFLNRAAIVSGYKITPERVIPLENNVFWLGLQDADDEQMIIKFKVD